MRAFLQIGQALVFQLRNSLQVFYVAFQLGLTRFGVAQFALFGNTVFLARLRFDRAFAAIPKGSRIRLRQLELVSSRACRSFIFDSGGDFSFGFLPGSRRFGGHCRLHTASNFFLIGFPVGGLRRDQTAGIHRRDCFCRFPVRDRQDHAALQTIDIAANKRILVGTLKRDQHLVERDATGLGLTRDLAQRIASFDFIASRHAGRLGLRCALR